MRVVKFLAYYSQVSVQADFYYLIMLGLYHWGSWFGKRGVQYRCA